MSGRAAKLLSLSAAVALAVGFWVYGSRRAATGSVMSAFNDPAAIEQQAAVVARHRDAQRVATAAPAPETAPSPAPIAANRPPAAIAPVPYWTDFRGPLRDGHYRERPIRTSWPAAGLTPVWKQPIGGGHASWVAAHGRAFTIEQRGREEVATAYDVATGREIWTSRWTATFSEHYGGVGPRATPTWSRGEVFILGATGELRALDAATGALRWRTNILDDAGATNLPWGMAASPLVVGDAVVVLPGGSQGRSVVAYDRRSGRRIWSALDDAASYASPMLVTLGGVEQILVFTATRLVGLSLDGARLLWEFAWPSQNGINPSQPLVIGDSRVFVSTDSQQGAALIELSQQNGVFSVREIWRTNRMKNQFTSSVHHDGFIYGLDDSILACLDASTGALKWKGGRYGFGELLLASGHLVLVTEQGELALIRANPDRLEEIVRFPVLDGPTWNHPAIADGLLLLRNITTMAAFDLRPQ
jgi:outer membrane protein assembly factor BamB